MKRVLNFQLRKIKRYATIVFQRTVLFVYKTVLGLNEYKYIYNFYNHLTLLKHAAMFYDIIHKL